MVALRRRVVVPPPTAWPEITIMGTDSIQAPATAVTALVAPGPVVTIATPMFSVMRE